MRSRMVAVAGAKGSPGCSFVALGLARCFAAGGLATMLLDADAEGGGLAPLLDVRAGVGPQRLGRAVDLGGIDHRAVRQAAARVGERLWFTQVGDGEGARPFEGAELAGAACTEHEAVVVDLGHMLGSQQRQLAAASDWLLWVVMPDRSGLERADHALAERPISAPSAGLVFNRMGRGTLPGAEEALARCHRMPVMARFQEDRRLAEAVFSGTSQQVRGFDRLARSLHPDSGAVAAAWP